MGMREYTIAANLQVALIEWTICVKLCKSKNCFELGTFTFNYDIQDKNLVSSCIKYFHSLLLLMATRN